MDSRDAGILLCGILIVGLALLSLLWQASRGGTLLDGWARANGFQILSMEHCWLFKGPFFWTASNSQRVYRVTIRDREGRIRFGYVRCGGYWLGMISDHVEARWDD